MYYGHGLINFDGNAIAVENVSIAVSITRGLCYGRSASRRFSSLQGGDNQARDYTIVINDTNFNSTLLQAIATIPDNTPTKTRASLEFVFARVINPDNSLRVSFSRISLLDESNLLTTSTSSTWVSTGTVTFTEVVI